MSADGSPIVLDAREQRVLGSLMEKGVTVPASYPLTLNALRTACNQSSSREPVTAYTDDEVRETVNGLRRRDLLHVDHGSSRALRYRQLLDLRLELDDDERALIAVLLLRGAQAPGELRSRTERLHLFPDRSSVEEVLGRLATREPPLVRELPKGSGERDHRWVHLLGPVESAPEPPPDVPAVDRESVLAAGASARDELVRTAYDRLAQAYAADRADALGRVPFDAWLLTRVAALAAPDPIVDVGCGPGHNTAHLAADGAAVTGIDISPQMVTLAQAAHPQASFEVGDFARLMRPRAAHAWGGVVAWYAMPHLAPSELASVLAGFHRVLRLDGWLALALHIGDSVVHLREVMGEAADVEVVLHDPAAVRAAVSGSGFAVEETYVRGPRPDEDQVDRLYVLARRAG